MKSELDPLLKRASKTGDGLRRDQVPAPDVVEFAIQMTLETAIGPRVIGPPPRSRGRRSKGFVLRLSRFWSDLLRWDALVTIGIVLPQMFALQLKSLSPAISLACCMIALFRYRKWAVSILAHRWFMLLLPAMAVLSTAWSDYPGITFKYSLEMAILAGTMLVLSASPYPMAILGGFMGSFAVFMVVSVMFGQSVGMSVNGTTESAFAGLNAGKNFMGMTACFAVLVTTAFIAAALKARSFLLVAVSTVVLCVELYAAVAARSAGSLIGLMAAMVALIGALTLSSMPFRWRVGSVIVLSFGALLFAAFSSVIVRALIQFAATTFNKDPTLTGRTYLWYRGADMIREHPYIGRGYSAFWVQGNLDAEGLWRYGHISSRAGFNFHNTMMELLIHYGWIGTLLAMATGIVGVFMLARRLVMTPSAPACLMLSFAAYQLVRMPFESLVPAPNDFWTAFTFLALGFGFRGVPATPVRRRTKAPMRRMNFGPTVAVFEPRFTLPGTPAAPARLGRRSR
jgi:exopolysaccharide production protein ExoQ